MKLVRTDLESFGFGSRLGITRSWTNRNPYAYYDGGFVGNNWFINELPAMDEADGEVYDYALANTATDVRFFDKRSGSAGEALFGATEKLTYNSEYAFIVTDAAGDKLEFVDYFFPETSGQTIGHIARFTDPSGAVTKFEYDGTLPTQISRQSDVNGEVLHEAFVFEHGTGSLSSLVAAIRLERKVGVRSQLDPEVITWGATEVLRKVVYSYYGTSDPNGNPGDLRTAMVKDGDDNVISTEYYRYYSAADQPTAFQGGLKYVLTSESFDRARAAVGDPLQATDTALAPYADLYLEYDSSHRVTKEVAQREGCTVCTGGQGTYVYEYENIGLQGVSHDFNQAVAKTTVYLPDTTPEDLDDNNREIIYTNFIGAPIFKVLKEAGDAGQEWRSYWHYNSRGQVDLMAEPSAVDNSFNPDASGTSDAYGHTDIIGYNSTTQDFAGLYDDRGLVHRYAYYGSTSAVVTSDAQTDLGDAGGVKGYLERTSVQRGDGGGTAAVTTAVVLEERSYYAHSDGDLVTVYPLAAQTNYTNDNSTGAQTTTYAYTFYANSAAIESTTVTHPAVASAQNGPGTSASEVTFFNKQGQEIWSKDAAGHISYFAYDFFTGAGVKRIADVDTDQTADFDASTLPDGWANTSGLHLTTTCDVDPLGRITRLTNPNQQGSDVATYYFYDDVNHSGDSLPGSARETRIYPNWSTSTHSTTGPVTVHRDDRATSGNSYTETLTIAPSSFNFDSGTGRPTGDDALTTGGILRSATRTYYSDAAQAVSEDRYFNLPTTWTGSISFGTENTNFYRTRYRYDETGQLNRIQSPTGTITRYLHDAMKRVTSVWVGTDDTDSNPGNGTLHWSPSDASDGEFNLGRITDYVYDNGGSGNSNLTDIIEHVEHVASASGVASTDRRTVMAYDWRNRLVLKKSGQTSKHVAKLTPTGTIEAGDKFIVELTDDAGRGSITVSAPSTAVSDLTNAIATAFNASTDTRFLSITATATSTEVTLTTDAWGGFFRLSVSTTEANDGGADAQRFATAAGTPVLNEPTTGIIHRPIAYLTYDNLDRVLAQERFDGDNLVVAAPNGVASSPSGSLRTAKATTEYDSRGRVFRARLFSVAPGLGTIGDSLETGYWYDFRGNLMKLSEPGGLVHKYEYDGVGRLRNHYVTDGGADTATGQTDTWNTASTAAGDIVLTQTENEYDGNGNVIFVIIKDRFHDDATTTGALTASIARVSYSANYYDAVDRLTATVNAGTNGGSAYSRFASKATSGTTSTLTDTTLTGTSTDYVGKTLIITAGAGIGGRATVTAYDSGTKTLTFSPAFTGSINNTSAYTLAGEELVTGHVYDDADRVWKQIDPRGIETRTLYDALGRTTKTIEAYMDGVPSDADDRTTVYTYDGSGHLRTMTADMPGMTPDQTTEYVYTKPSGATGSDINSNDLLWQVKYPGEDDPVTPTVDESGVASELEKEVFTYNALGERKTLTDRNGNVHGYAYDVLGRVTSDTVTSLGTNVQGQVRRIDFTFDSAGRPQTFTSFATAAGMGLLNQVRREYNGFGQLTKEYQDDPNGGGGGAPFVEYVYGVDGGTNRSVLTSVKYPNGRVVDYNYVPVGGSSGLNDRISRLDNIAEGTNVREGYSYLGLATIVKLERPESGVDLTYVGTLTGDYLGLDRFGRVIDQRWVDDNDTTTTTTDDIDVDRFKYGYDRNGDRLYRDNLLNSNFDELYRANSTASGDSNAAYDALNRLKGFRRGALSASGNNGGQFDTVATASRTQGWTLDALGNWSSVTTESQSRQHNSQNQLTQVNGSTLTYDNNGNMTKDQNGNTLAYDAWNRLARVLAPAGNLLVSYRYDALGRRIAETKLEALSGAAVTLSGGTIGNDTFRIAAGSTSGTLDVYRGTTLVQTVSGTEIILNGFSGGGGNDTINVEAGTVHIVTDFGAANVALNVTGSGTIVQVASDRQHLSSLSIGSGSTVKLQPGRQTVLVVAAGTGGSQLSITSGGTLDVGDNAVLLRSDATNRDADYDALNAWTAEAYAYREWTGTGITSSTAATEDEQVIGEGLVGVGTIQVDASDGDELALGILGENPGTDDILVRFTYAGDATLNGVVDVVDYGAIDNWVQFPGADGYSNGDFNYDGVIDGADYGVIDDTIQLQAQGRLEHYTRRLYYSDDWQVLEERVRAKLDAQQIWSPRYVDAMVLRDRDLDGDGAADDERLYVQQDANFNVTSVINAAGAVQERYAYDPYGSVTVLDANWANDSNGQTDVSWVYLHQSGRYDARSGLYSFRHREYSPELGRWMQQDPAGYVDGSNVYEYVGSQPVTFTDAWGLAKFPGCSLCQRDALSADVDRAKQQAKDLLLEINKALAGPLIGKKDWGIRQKMEKARNCVQKTLGQLDRMNITCQQRPPKKDRAIASVPPGPRGSKDVDVWPAYWTTNDNYQAATLVHEATHQVCGTIDNGTYFDILEEAPNDAGYGFEGLASTYDSWILGGFSIPGITSPPVQTYPDANRSDRGTECVPCTNTSATSPGGGAVR